MKVIILAAGQGSRLRPLTDEMPKCMVKVHGISIIDRQLNTMHACGIKENDITVVAGYCADVLREKFAQTGITVVCNKEYRHTNMVYSLMCAEELFQRGEDLLISYGDIIYEETVLKKILNTKEERAVIADDGWYAYWAKRCENPLDDAESFRFGKDDYLLEIGQKTDDLKNIQSQYIGLIRFQGQGVKDLLDTVTEARSRSKAGANLWKTKRSYENMYMTDLLQGMIEEGKKLKVLHIQRGWFEVDQYEDLKLAEEMITDASEN